MQIHKYITRFIYILIATSIALTTPSYAATIVMHTTLGAKVYFKPTTGPKIVDIALVWQAGSAYDHSLPGISKLTHSLMRQGAGDMSASAFSNALNATGAEITGSSNRSYAYWHLRSLTSMHYLRPALSLFKTMLDKPTFSAAELQKKVKRQIAAITAIGDSPASVASDALIKNIYANSVLGHSILGNQASLEKITPADVKSFYNNYYNRSNVTVVIVGAIKRSEALRLAQAVVRNLPAGKRAVPIAKLHQLTASKQVKINYPSKQTHIILAQIGVPATAPDYFPLIVGNQKFGGGMSSTLFNELRNKRGLVYSVYSQWLPTPYGGLFIINLSTRPQQAAKALALSNKLLIQYQSRRLTRKQVISSRNNLAGKFILQQDSNSGILQQLITVAAYNYNPDFLQNYVRNIKKVTANSILKAAQANIQPNKMLLVEVGPDIKATSKTKS